MGCRIVEEYTPGGNPGFSIVTTVILGFIDVLFI
jgi:hypothetical protein